MAKYVNVGNGQYLNARNDHSTSSSIKYYIPHGEEVTVSSTYGNWSKVTVVDYPGKGSAWVMTSYLSDSEPSILFDTETYALGNKTLQTGRFGRYTYNLQIGLGITADGVFGSATETAVRNFQESHGLSIDGIAGSGTKGALWSAASNTIIQHGK